MKPASHFPLVRPAADVVETEGGIRIVASMPGTDVRDLEMIKDEGILHIKGVSRCPIPQEDGMHLHGLEFGNVEFLLDIVVGDVPAKAIEAGLDHGLLTVFLPAAPGGQIRPVELR